jgi:alpha-D-ribose 1-methylphosphonate 5-triphosphate synthase subunit PhnL
MPARLILDGVTKSFTMHLQGGATLAVLRDVSFSVEGGECVVLGGPSGIGKSSILRMIYGNYAAAGRILVADGGRTVDVAAAEPRTILGLRRRVVGYVSQFLRVVPRVATRDVVAEPLLAAGIDPDEAAARAETMLARLNLPRRLWDLPPATFSGGEQQRVNVARGFVTDRPILLLDEPTASLDGDNRAAVIDLIAAKKTEGVALLGIFHDETTRAAVADRTIDVAAFAARGIAA